MGMPVTVDIEEASVKTRDIERIFDYFTYVDETYSPYKASSEVSQINQGLPEAQWSDEMREILTLCKETEELTKGYFNIRHNGAIDPSGLVKGWAINKAAELVREMGFTNFYIEAGGDIQVSGVNANSEPWSVGIRNPFNRDEIVKVVQARTEGVATSGTYIRGQHIYNPPLEDAQIDDVASLTVIGPSIYEADRFATAAFAMGKPGIHFIESLEGFEGYMIDSDKQATLTSGFNQYTINQ
jgi:thiamine biosynthesis lipoprotein